MEKINRLIAALERAAFWGRMAASTHGIDADLEKCEDCLTEAVIIAFGGEHGILACSGERGVLVTKRDDKLCDFPCEELG